IRKSTIGFLARPAAWWEHRTLDDREERRRGAGPLNRVLLELDGKPAGYAIYRIKVEGSGSEWSKKIVVHDAFGVDPRATREIWRFLLEIDWTDELETRLLPLDHPLLLLTARGNELRRRLWDGLWLRLVAVDAALATGAVSSVGRAPARQAGGHWFEPSTAHSLKALVTEGLCRLRSQRGLARGNKMATVPAREHQRAPSRAVAWLRLITAMNVCG